MATPSYNPALHRFAFATVCATLVLIVAGGLVTSNDAGLSVPDWPLSYGELMPPMVGGILYEHTHRMIAASVGFLTIVLAAWLWLKEPRRWVRRLGAVGLATVIVQGIVGGVTVLFFLPPAVSIVHACLAQTFFCLIVTLAVVTGRGWESNPNCSGRSVTGSGPLAERPLQLSRPALPLSLTTAAIFVQLILGATVRHTGMVNGSKGATLVLSALVTHLAGAFAVAVLVIYSVLRVFRLAQKRAVRLASFLLILLVIQLVLGLGAYLARLATQDLPAPMLPNVLVTTAHVAVGALLLATSLILTLRSPSFWHAESQIDFFALKKTKAFLELTKPRVTLLVTLTTAAGVYLASSSPLELELLLNVMIGTALVAGGTAVLNQFMERDADARMLRTEGRPLPSGRLEPRSAMIFGLLLVASGTAYLALSTNLLTAFLGAITAIVYLFIYTPLKTRSTLCTLVGAFPGAVPPLMGWAAARGELNLQAWVLFTILFLWQFPHFLAISWLYREDYERGGFTMLPVPDLEGRQTGLRIAIYSFALVAASLIPSLVGLAGMYYLGGALLLGVLFLQVGIKTAMSRSKTSAKRLLHASVLYLPLLLILMVVDKAN